MRNRRRSCRAGQAEELRGQRPERIDILFVLGNHDRLALFVSEERDKTAELDSARRIEMGRRLIEYQDRWIEAQGWRPAPHAAFRLPKVCGGALQQRLKMQRAARRRTISWISVRGSTEVLGAEPDILGHGSGARVAARGIGAQPDVAGCFGEPQARDIGAGYRDLAPQHAILVESGYDPGKTVTERGFAAAAGPVDDQDIALVEGQVDAS